MQRTVIRARALFIAIALAAVSSARGVPTTIYDPVLTGGAYNVIANFEVGNMSEFNGNFGIGQFTAFNDSPIIGNFSAVTNTPNDANGPGYAALKTVNVTSGQAYIVSGFFNRGNIDTGGLYIDLNDIANEVQLVLDPETAQTQFIYDTFVPNFTGQVTLRMVRDGQRLGGESAYIDNIGFTLAANFAPAIPEPTSLAIVSVMAGLVLRRRR